LVHNLKILSWPNSSEDYIIFTNNHASNSILAVKYIDLGHRWYISWLGLIGTVNKVVFRSSQLILCKVYWTFLFSGMIQHDELCRNQYFTTAEEKFRTHFQSWCHWCELFINSKKTSRDHSVDEEYSVYYTQNG